MPRLRETPSQTAGPYVHIGAVPTFAGLEGIYPEDLGSGPLYQDGVKGQKITIKGRIIDGSGTPLDQPVLAVAGPAGGLVPVSD